MNQRLTTDETQLLRQVISKHRPELLHLLGLLGTVTLTDDQREGLRAGLLDELCETGLSQDEPNPRGVLLDDLIGALGRF